MALFGSSKNKTVLSKKIRPTVVRTQNVTKELMNLASTYGTKVDKLDFNLLDVQTYIRVNKDTQESEWEEIGSNELYELDDKTALLNSNFQIKQMFEIEIIPKNTREDLYSDFHIAVGANATKCKIYLSIKEGSKISYSSGLEEDLRLLINKKKIRAGILINIFDEMLDDVISKMSALIRVKEYVVYSKNETHLIAQGIEPTLTLNDNLILHYDKKEDVSEYAQIDYARRGFIHSVNKGELLIEYVKAQIGKPGRNCRGEFIKPKEPKIEHAPTFQVDDTIKRVETPKNIQYIANENGYVSLEGNTYLIKSDIDVGEITFKTTGSIESNLDSEVSITVKESNAIKDAIGTGMDVEVNEITVEGNVGSHAKVNAIKATIEGQTHATAEVRATDLRINIHKGSAYGNNINITRLEHGTIDGDIVNISQAIGGKIKAKEIKIELCGSYVHATASKLIEITKLQGQENVFIIDPLLKRDTSEGLEENKHNVDELEFSVNIIKKEIEKYTKLINGGMSAFNDIKKRLINYKKNGVKMPESFVKKYKQFQKMQEHLVGVKKEYKQKNDQLALLTTKTLAFQEDIFEARIINRDRWIGHNEIKFRLIDPPIEVTYNPSEGSLEKIFAVVEVEDGQYEIQAVKE